jgi:hypothetical protein
MSKTLPELHEEIFQAYDKFRTDNPNLNFNFPLRSKDSKQRLSAGLWFLGNSNYICTSPFLKGDQHNKTKTINLVFNLIKIEGQDSCFKVDRAYIELAFGDPQNKQYALMYQEIALLIHPQINNYQTLFKIDIDFPLAQNLSDTVLSFLNQYYEKILAIIAKNNLEESFLLDSETFKKQQNRRDEIITHGLADLNPIALDDEDESEPTIASPSNTDSKCPLNQILYGPPGTGKTYHTINHALAIIERKTLQNLELEDRNSLKNRFDKYLENDQIIFTTFH